jgi:hypothetical protein
MISQCRAPALLSKLESGRQPLTSGAISQRQIQPATGVHSKSGFKTVLLAQNQTGADKQRRRRELNERGALAVIPEVLRINPDFAIERWKRLTVYNDPKDAEHRLTGCARPGCRKLELRVPTVMIDDASLPLSPCVTPISACRQPVTRCGSDACDSPPSRLHRSLRSSRMAALPQ